MTNPSGCSLVDDMMSLTTRSPRTGQTVTVLSHDDDGDDNKIVLPRSRPPAKITDGGIRQSLPGVAARGFAAS